VLGCCSCPPSQGALCVPFVLSQLRAELAVLSTRGAEKENSKVLPHFFLYQCSCPPGTISGLEGVVRLIIDRFLLSYSRGVW